MPEEKLANKKGKGVRQLISVDPSILSEDRSLRELLEEIIKDTRFRHVYIVNNNNELSGSVRINNTIQYLFPSI